MACMCVSLTLNIYLEIAVRTLRIVTRVASRKSPTPNATLVGANNAFAEFMKSLLHPQFHFHFVDHFGVLCMRVLN
jgi:hypothetical protein